MVQVSFRWMRTSTEIPVLLLFYSFMVSDPVDLNFVIYRTCTVTFGFNETACEKLGSKNPDNATAELEKIVQPYANVIKMVQSLVTQILPALLVLFIGPWSDKHGRKPVLTSTILGFTIAGVIGIIVCLIPTLSPWYVLLAAIPAVAFGGFSPFLMAVLCYITDITTDENRGMRIGIFEAMFALGALLGNVSSSFIFSFGGYIGVYGLAMVCNILACLYTIFVLVETVTTTAEQDDTSIFSLNNVKDMLKTTFKARESYVRAVLLLSIAMATFYILGAVSDASVFFLFLREHMHWDLQKYTLYKTVREILVVAGTIVGISVLHKRLKISESPMLLLGFTAYFVSVLMQGLANQDWQIYAAGGIRCICGVISPMYRSLISKLIATEESGKVFSIMVTLESMTTLIGAPLYTLVYNGTLDTLPGAFNFVTAGIFAVEIIFVMIVIVLQKTQLNRHVPMALLVNEEEEEEEKED